MRLSIVLLLIVALIAAPLAPARAGWSCPDGTPCVAEGERGYRCAGECGVSSCCDETEGRRCRHGALPGVASSRAGEAFQRPDHCRFSRAEQPDLTALRDGSKLLVWAAPEIALLTAAFQVPQAVASHVAWIVDTCASRPPPLLSAGPARAPPSA